MLFLIQNSDCSGIIDDDQDELEYVDGNTETLLIVLNVFLCTQVYVLWPDQMSPKFELDAEAASSM